MRRYNAFFDSIGRNPSSPRIDPEVLKWLPLLFIVVSTSSKASLTAARHCNLVRTTRASSHRRANGLVEAVLRKCQE